MSARLRSRALDEGRVKALRRMKQPMTLVLEASISAHAPAARALGQRGMCGSARYIPCRGAQRRTDRMALQALLRQEDWNE